MSKSNIEWTEQTWNPTTGCDKVSPGCKHCYAERMSKRLKGMGQEKYKNGFKLTTHEASLHDPFKWKGSQRCFVNSMSDLFHEAVPFGFIDRVFIVMAMNPQHTFQILTKRPMLMQAYFEQRKTDDDWWDYVKDDVDDYGYHLDQQHMPDGWCYDVTYSEFGKDSRLIYDGEWPLKNVWLGTSVENQATADERIPLLQNTPAAVRFLSCEPLLEDIWILWPLGYGTCRDGDPSKRIHWVITGGESGPKARPIKPEWVRSLRDQCLFTGVPFFFKQWGGTNKKATGNLLDGVQHLEFPKNV